MTVITQWPCKTCNTNGTIDHQLCKECKGTGVTVETHGHGCNCHQCECHNCGGSIQTTGRKGHLC